MTQIVAFLPRPTLLLLNRYQESCDQPDLRIVIPGAKKSRVTFSSSKCVPAAAADDDDDDDSAAVMHATMAQIQSQNFEKLEIPNSKNMQI